LLAPLVLDYVQSQKSLPPDTIAIALSTVFIETCYTQVQLKRNVLIRVCFVSISSFQRTNRFVRAVHGCVGRTNEKF